MEIFSFCIKYCNWQINVESIAFFPGNIKFIVLLTNVNMNVIFVVYLQQ